MMEAGDTRVFLQATRVFLHFYPGVNFFPTGGNYFLNWKEIFFLTGEILGSNCGHGEELADEEDLRRGDFLG